MNSHFGSEKKKKRKSVKKNAYQFCKNTGDGHKCANYPNYNHYMTIYVNETA